MGPVSGALSRGTDASPGELSWAEIYYNHAASGSQVLRLVGVLKIMLNVATVAAADTIKRDQL